MVKTFVVYMLASKPNGTLYIGVTSNLVARLWQHRHHVAPGFTERYDVIRLVWCEVHAGAESAIRREKQLKKWRRAWKVQLLSEANPDWTDLAPQILAEWGGGTVAGGGTVEQDGTAKEDGFPRTRE
jgi:putative endonuclease